MELTNPDRELIETTSLKAFFHDEINGVLDRRHPSLSEDARAYTVNLLYQFSRSDRFFEWYEQRIDLRPLAMLYGEAVQTQSLHERRQMLRRLGDIALFMAGVFGPSLERKPVGLDYYINMGGGAYDWLSESLAASGEKSLRWQIFHELAENFAQMVRALDEFAASSGLRGDPDRIALDEAWRDSLRRANAPEPRHAH